MKGYKELAKLRIFSLAEVENMAGNKKTAYSMLARLMDKGLVKKIRNNVYSCVNPATGEVMVSKYQIACANRNSAYISHHTAFEYYGLANQVYYEVYVSSDIRFRDFEFEGIKYKRIASKLNKGVVQPRNSEGIRVTDLERTVVDSIKDFEKIGGFEELINCLSTVNYLDEEKLKAYLNAYDIQALYQKTGFILEQYMNEMQISSEFLEYCKRQTGKSTRYLLRESRYDGIYNSEWKLVIPEEIFYIKEQGDGDLAR